MPITAIDAPPQEFLSAFNLASESMPKVKILRSAIMYYLPSASDNFPSRRGTAVPIKISIDQNQKRLVEHLQYRRKNRSGLNGGHTKREILMEAVVRYMYFNRSHLGLTDQDLAGLLHDHLYSLPTMDELLAVANYLADAHEGDLNRQDKLQIQREIMSALAREVHDSRHIMPGNLLRKARKHAKDTDYEDQHDIVKCCKWYESNFDDYLSKLDRR